MTETLDLPSPPAIARALGGECRGNRIRCPGPGHSRRDRSLEIWLQPDAPGGYLVHSFAGDDPRACRDYVREALGLDPWRQGTPPRRIVQPAVRSVAAQRDAERRREIAQRLWARSGPGPGSLVEHYLSSRAIALAVWPATIRYLPPTRDHLWPTMIAAYALPRENEPGSLALTLHDIVGCHLTYLRHDGRGKAPIDPAKRTIGREHSAPVVAAPIGDNCGLIIAEGIEDALSLHVATGLGAWAAGGASRMLGLAVHVPACVEVVTIAADDDEAGRKAASALGEALRARRFDVNMLIGTAGGRDGKIVRR